MLIRSSLLIAAAVLTTSIAPDTACASGACCKTCKAGKPCGDTCIAKKATCKHAAGCACQG